jgi:hypothetical protein
MDKIIITILGLLGILFTAWFFLRQPAEKKDGKQEEKPMDMNHH